MAAEYKMIGGDGREYGPASLEEIRQWCEEGRIAHGTPVWRNDEARWQPAAGWDELKWDLPTLPSVARTVATASPPVEVRTRPAGFWIRTAAYLIDWVILTTFAQLIMSPWGDQISRLNEVLAAGLKAGNPDVHVMGQLLLISLAVGLPTGFAYNGLFNGWRGATPGKQLLGLRVLRDDGAPLGYPRAFLRYAAELVSALTFGLGYLMVAIHPQKRALHDLLARTQVIRVR